MRRIDNLGACFEEESHDYKAYPAADEDLFIISQKRCQRCTVVRTEFANGEVRIHFLRKDKWIRDANRERQLTS